MKRSLPTLKDCVKLGYRECAVLYSNQCHMACVWEWRALMEKLDQK